MSWYKKSKNQKYDGIIISLNNNFGLGFVVNASVEKSDYGTGLNIEIKDIKITSLEKFCNFLYKFIFKDNENKPSFFKEFQEQIRKYLYDLNEYKSFLGERKDLIIDFHGLRFCLELTENCNHVTVKKINVINPTEFENFLREAEPGVLDVVKETVQTTIPPEEYAKTASCNKLFKKISGRYENICVGGVCFNVSVSGTYKPRTLISPDEYPVIDEIIEADIEDINEFEQNFVFSSEWESEYFDELVSTVSIMKKYGIFKENIIFEMNGVRLYYKITNFKEPTDGCEIIDAKIMDLQEFIQNIPKKINEKLDDAID